MKEITIKKDPFWMIYLGILLAFSGSLTFVPFKFESWTFISLLLKLILFSGLLILFRCSQKIGWTLNQSGNVLYYQKFNLYSSWKTRRSTEYSIGIENISSIDLERSALVIRYKYNKQLRFNTHGLDRKDNTDLEEFRASMKSLISDWRIPFLSKIGL